MKKNTLLLLILAFTSVMAFAQDTLYIYKGGAVVSKRAVAQIDSITFTAPSPLAGTFQDIDGNIYHTVTIGTQTWMLENLKTTKFRNGESIPNVTDNAAWAGLTSAAWCDYDNSASNGNIFGHLYNWYAATDSRNIAPAGWHVPTLEEWQTLEAYLIANGYNYDGSTTGNKFSKSIASNNYWTANTGVGAPGNSPINNNSTRFSALPAGMRYGHSGIFGNYGTSGYFWTATLVTDIDANYKGIFYGYNFFNTYQSSMKHGFSIRCIKSDLPEITTTAAGTITSTSVASGGNITFDGNDPITARGICWNTTGNPTIADQKTIDGSGKGTFNSSITALNPGTTYYICAYATNSVGTAYGNVITFKTTATKPTLTTVAVTEITANSATSGGDISNDGGATVSARGVCWSTNPNPTTDSFKTTDGAGPGTFSSALTNLASGTIYYVRAYATNNIGTSYGNEVSFSTPSVYASFISDAIKSVVSTNTFVHFRTTIPFVSDESQDFNLTADNSIVTDLDNLVLATSTKDGIAEKTFEGYGLGLLGTDYKFEFSLPTYVGLDGITNQNSFVTLNAATNVLTVNPGPSAYDRKPLVKVQLKSMTGNLLATAYIKFKIIAL